MGECILLWIIGWFLLSVGNYIWKVYIDKDIWTSKKLHAWRSFWAGICSWAGIIFWVAIFIAFEIEELNEWIEKKLK